MRIVSAFVGILFISWGYAQEGGHFGGSVPAADSISQAQAEAIRVQVMRTKLGKSGTLQQRLLFHDPMGGGGMNSFGKTIVNYVDLDPGESVQDYNCGAISYNGHRGTDPTILNFFEMDEGVPILCAAPGVVAYVHDGEFDRQTEWLSGVTANAVTVIHGDGSEARYLHMRKNSVRVGVGDTVAVGDTLGLVGSSGYSSGPHIHFEIRDSQGETIDPFHGPCQPDSTRWVEQGAYILDLPFEMMDHGLTTIPLSWPMVSERPPTKTHVHAPDTIFSWLRLRNARHTDVLKWDFYTQGSLWNTYSFSPDQTYTSSWWYVWWILPSSSAYYGDWTLRIYWNDSLIALQDFAYDAQANQLPVISNETFDVLSGSFLEGEFHSEDPDGSIFWYELVYQPVHGSLEQYGGRKRKFHYSPIEAYLGMDSVVFYAIDDENTRGSNGTYYFNVVSELAIIQSSGEIPADFNLHQNYPNPFNPISTIRYDVPEASHVSLIVYDILGRKTVRLVDSFLEPGYHAIQWDGRDSNGRELPSGIYITRLVTTEYTKSIKMVLLK